MKQKKAVSVKQLQELYTLTTHGSNASEAARIVGLEEATAVVARRRLTQYIAWVAEGEKDDGHRHRYTYVLAARWAIKQDRMTIKKAVQTEIPMPEEEGKRTMEGIKSTVTAFVPPTEPTNYDKLDLNFAVFKDAMHAFIEAEVVKRVGKVMDRNKELESLIDSAKLGNFADALKQKWEGQK